MNSLYDMMMMGYDPRQSGMGDTVANWGASWGQPYQARNDIGYMGSRNDIGVVSRRPWGSTSSNAPGGPGPSAAQVAAAASLRHGGPRNDMGYRGNSAYGYASQPVSFNASQRPLRQPRNDMGYRSGRPELAGDIVSAAASQRPLQSPLGGSVSSNTPGQPRPAALGVISPNRPAQSGVGGVSGYTGSLGAPRRQIRRDPRGTDIGYRPSGGGAPRERGY